MRISQWDGVWAVAAVVVSGVVLSAKPATITGTVSDSMCGAKHMMASDPAGCTRACVKKGAGYALVVKDKVYTLDASTAAIKDALDKHAGQTVEVTGDVDGKMIHVSAVSGR